jgi:hypothetical protein
MGQEDRAASANSEKLIEASRWHGHEADDVTAQQGFRSHHPLHGEPGMQGATDSIQAKQSLSQRLMGSIKVGDAVLHA